MREPYDRLLQDSMKNELRVINAQVPGEYKNLEELLTVDRPAVSCNDGTTHIFKRRELQYLAGMLDKDERESLLLPVLIEVNPGDDEIVIVCRGEVEEKLFSAVLDMPVKAKQGRIVIHKPQLAVIRKHMKTTTQYVFSPKILR